MSPATLEAIANTAARRSPIADTNRCVHCGHSADKTPCKYAPCKEHETMSLGGKTCAVCVHVERCCSIFGQLPEDRQCQFFPIRFRATEVQV